MISGQGTGHQADPKNDVVRNYPRKGNELRLKEACRQSGFVMRRMSRRLHNTGKVNFSSPGPTEIVLRAVIAV
jgi:hypothetical protein